MTAAAKTRRPFILAAVMTNMFMIAIEATIVSTAMPQIAAQLGDLHLYSWVFAAFLLTQAATTALFGKLADLYGRKPILMIGIAVFLAGSLLCGLAWSMPSMIAFRLLQGVGAGAIMPVNLTVVGDLYAARERGRIQGYLASVWGASSLFGPLAGALIIQHVSWSWIFWINLPIGLAAAAGFSLFLKETVTPQKRTVDIPGAALFAVAVAALMLAFTEIGGHANAVASAAAVFAVSAALFVVQERRAREPMIDFRLWTRRPIATANVATLLSGMAMIGLTTFLPMYVQGVLNHSALVAGFALTMMVLGWPIGSTIGAKAFPRIGLRRTLLLGAALLPTGAVAFLLLAPGVSPVVAGLGSAVMGLGMGFLSTAAIVIIQENVGWSERGSATASNVLARNLGSTLGATVFGGLLNASLAGSATASAGHVTFDDIRRLLDHPAALIEEATIRSALGHALHLTFWGVFVVAALTLASAMLVPTVALARAKAPAQ